MKVYTAMLRSDGEGGPVMVPEGFSVGAMILGPLWLAAHRAFPAAAAAALCWAVAIGLPAPFRGVAAVGLVLAQGMFGTDAWRAEMARRGYVTAHAVLGRDDVAAWARLLAARPDLIPRMAP